MRPNAFSNIMTAEQVYTQKLAGYNGRKIHDGLNQKPSDPAAKARAIEYRDIRTAMLFHCDPKIAKKINGMKAKDGNELLQDKGDHFLAYNSTTGEHDVLDKIIAKIDPKTKMQVCAAYNAKHNDLFISFGGTDFANASDMSYAIASTMGKLNPRIHAALDGTEQVLQRFQEKYPDVKPQDVNVAIMGHSSGAASVPAALVATTAQDFTVNQVDILAPFGGKQAFELTAQAVQIPVDALEQNVTTLQPGTKGPLEKLFKETCGEIGNREECSAHGHMGAHFITAFNNDRTYAAKQ